MTKNIEFTKGNWEEHFRYASSDRFDFEPRFYQEEGCIVNGRNPEMVDGFDYTTIMTKEMYKEGTKIWLTCSFEEYGAPLVTLTDRIRKAEDGNYRHGPCHEFVVWENGLNIWHMFDVDGEIKFNQLLGLDFHLEPGVKHELYLEIMDKCIRIVLGGQDVLLRIEDLPKEVYLGITGCENINRFYDLRIETL